jgi:hypothetical protein
LSAYPAYGPNDHDSVAVLHPRASSSPAAPSPKQSTWNFGELRIDDPHPIVAIPQNGGARQILAYLAAAILLLHGVVPHPFFDFLPAAILLLFAFHPPIFSAHCGDLHQSQLWGDSQSSSAAGIFEAASNGHHRIFYPS